MCTSSATYFCMYLVYKKGKTCVRLQILLRVVVVRVTTYVTRLSPGDVSAFLRVHNAFCAQHLAGIVFFIVRLAQLSTTPRPYLIHITDIVPFTMMPPRHFIAIALTASSLVLAQNSPIPTKLLSKPVQPTAFSDDPALSTHRPLIIVTPSESVSGGQGESTSSVILTIPETTTTQENTLWVQTTMPTSTPSPTPSNSGLFPQTTFPPNSTTTTTTASSSSSASLTTLTGTHTTTLTSNPASVPTAFANAAAGLIALVGLAMAL
ncbi:hypothetical protein V8C26DRAFT_416802 [Trichoderma gracile]